MHFHLIATGGSAMHSLAIALALQGHHITGSDDHIYEPATSTLKKHDLLPAQTGWFPEKITPEIDAVIVGMHAKKDNPELLRAQEIGLKIYSYPEYIFEQSREKTRVVIAGSHGKTTITSMVLHVLRYHHRSTDYLVGASASGVENTVQLSAENDFIVLEGDEYLSSAIDPRPKFHHYQPNIALLSGIAWDHINVFPSFEEYVDQFRIFIDSVVKGGILVYNEEDPVLKKLVEESKNEIRKLPYRTAEYGISEGKTFLITPEGEMPVQIFGTHNMQNLSGAKWICQHMGIDEDDFYEAISSFSGAAKRLEKLFEVNSTVVYKDFAHSPSKVLATTAAVREQFPQKRLVACLELHTFSSLNSTFLKEYQNSLANADLAVVYFSPEAVQHKKLQPIQKEEIISAFGREDLLVFVNPSEFESFLKDLTYREVVLLLMSSGNYGGIDLEQIKGWIDN